MAERCPLITCDKGIYQQLPPTVGGSGVSQNLSAKSLIVSYGVLTIMEEERIDGPHVVASCFAEVAENVVFNADSAAVLRCEALAQLLRLKGVVAVTVANPTVDHRRWRTAGPLRSNISPRRMSIYRNVHLIRSDAHPVSE